MKMYGRAPRVTYLTVGSTTSEVGPGSYEVIQYTTKKSGKVVDVFKRKFLVAF